MNPNTTLITGFFDIGRQNWDAGFPRSNAVYLEYFNRLAGLQNPIVVYTSSQMVDVIKQQVKWNNVTFVVLDWVEKYSAVTGRIERVMKSPEYRAKLANNGAADFLPENRIPAYVAVTNRKIEWVSDAIDRGLVNTEYAAWIDFGYVREEATLAGLSQYDCPFEDDKIHMFSRRDLTRIKLEGAMLWNLVYFMGGSIVGKKESWAAFNEIYYSEFERFLQKGIIDDDQGFLLASYVQKPELFEAHITSDWFPLFKQFSKKS
jgi:protein YibB